MDLSLNEEQKKPVEDVEGAVLVLAGAGSGKTRVLTARIAHLVDDLDVPPENILAITFTNKAAREMKERLGDMIDIGGMWVCTIHSMCVKILRRFAEKCGIAGNFSIYSEQERTAVIKQAIRDCGYTEDGISPKTVHYHLSQAKMLGLTAEEYIRRTPGGRIEQQCMEVMRRYDTRLSSNNALDFDDLLLRTRLLLEQDAEVRTYLAGRFRYIHVDEFQDTNAVQFDIIKLLASVHGNLFVVGDDDQSIYGWRGAQIENILHFERSFPKAKVYKLQQNYRSTGAILALANASIAKNVRRKGKKLWTDAPKGEAPVWFEASDELEEAAYCARIIAEARHSGWRLSDFAVLMRINALTRSYEQEFTKYGLNYKVFGGFKFFERKEIKDVLAYLRLIANPFDDEAFRRVVNVPRRGIGDKTLETLSAYAEQEDISLYDAALHCDGLSLTSLARLRLGEFVQLVKDFVLRAQGTPVDELTRELIETSGMLKQYEDGTSEGEAKKANLFEFQNSVEEFVHMNEGAELSDYLQQITLYSDTDEMDDGDYITIATIHAVKGLEFRCVFFVGLEENIIPTSRSLDDPSSLEEERRLMYVGITRAREKLFLTRSRSRYLYGGREPTAPSRFIKEIAKELGVDKRTLSEQGIGKTYSGGYGSYGGYGSNGRNGAMGYGNSAPRRVGSYERQTEHFPTFGSGKPPVRMGIAPPSPVSAPPRPTPNFKVGMRVRHPKFGSGIVVGVRGEKNVIVTVRFETAGNKDLSAALAPLTVEE